MGARELAAIPPAELAPTERLTHQLLARGSRESLEWLDYPFHQHYIFIQMGGGLPNNLIRLVSQQPFRNEADYRRGSRDSSAIRSSWTGPPGSCGRAPRPG